MAEEDKYNGFTISPICEGDISATVFSNLIMWSWVYSMQHCTIFFSLFNHNEMKMVLLCHFTISSFNHYVSPFHHVNLCVFYPLFPHIRYTISPWWDESLYCYTISSLCFTISPCELVCIICTIAPYPFHHSTILRWKCIFVTPLHHFTIFHSFASYSTISQQRDRKERKRDLNALNYLTHFRIWVTRRETLG